MRPTILVITTGGTIDAEAYKETPENVSVKENSSIPSILEASKTKHQQNIEFRYVNLSGMDSKALYSNYNYIKEIANIINTSDEAQIILTTGTDRMPQISRFLKDEFFKGMQKSIIITGAMTPLSHGPESDGFANLEKAVEDVQKIESGVRVVMGGRLFEPDGLCKDFVAKKFYQNWREKFFSGSHRPNIISIRDRNTLEKNSLWARS